MIKLLVVDDEKGITDSLKYFFEQRGFSVETANSGEEALKIVGEDSPHIIFLDVKMKGMSGLEALSKIKNIDRNIKVIILSVIDDKEIVDRTMALGADEYVEKPFRLNYLEEVVIKKVQVLLYGQKNK